MDKRIKEILNRYPREISDLYDNLRQIIFDCSEEGPVKSLWAGMPSYYVGERFVRLIPFSNHINIEAKAVLDHKDKLCDYKITPKGMLQIYLKDEIPTSVLKCIFKETLMN